MAFKPDYVTPDIEILPGELWAHIPSYPDYYASTEGRIGSTKGRSFRVLKPKTDRGYHRVNLRINGVKKTKKVHRLILESFIGPCPLGMEACHGNRIRTDNRLSNLRWDTKEKNEHDKVAHGTAPIGSKHPQAILTEESIPQILEYLDQGFSQVDIACWYGVGDSIIGDIARNEKWRHVPRNPPKPVGLF